MGKPMCWKWIDVDTPTNVDTDFHIPEWVTAKEVIEVNVFHKYSKYQLCLFEATRYVVRDYNP